MAKAGPPLLKKWGQHFLEDKYYLELIADTGELALNDQVLEIGPGDGRLTERLLSRGARVTAIEIDPRWAAVLKERFSGNKNFTLIEGDFLKLPASVSESLFSETSQLKVIANLPYYITTPIVAKLLESRAAISLIIVMVQREFGERLAAAIGSREAGALTLYLQYYTNLEIISTVPATVFRPRPKVDSVILRIRPRKKPAVEVKEERIFWTLIKAAFGQRRKMLVNTLAAVKDEAVTKTAVESGLIELGISPKIRGEKMTLEEFASLCNFLSR